MNNLNNLKRNCFYFLIRCINAIFPKNNYKVIFASEPDFSDNALALYEYMIGKKRYKHYTYVWIIEDLHFKKKYPHTIFVKKHNSFLSFDYLRYLYHVFTSKYLFCTHSHFVEANPKRQISVCLWHGTMLKRICAMNEREKNMPRKKQFRYFISPSSFYVNFYCKSFLCKPKDILTCGYPRNDFLFQETDILKRLSIINDKNKLIVYMPTFRNPIGGEYSDSDDNHFNLINITSEKSLQDLSNFLIQEKVFLIIKWHPSDSRQIYHINLPNIITLTNKDITKTGLQTYHLLHYADALITDYSSVFCDFMLLDRPIAFDISDIDSYSQKRGLVFDNPIEFMPGYILKNKLDFITFINDISKNIDKSKEKRTELFPIFNDFKDNMSSKRILDLIC